MTHTNGLEAVQTGDQSGLDGSWVAALYERHTTREARAWRRLEGKRWSSETDATEAIRAALRRA